MMWIANCYSFVGNLYEEALVITIIPLHVRLYMYNY